MTHDLQRKPPEGPSPVDLSVLMVTYNHRHYILPCLRSVFQNTENLGLEIIVVDNHSRDGSIQLIRQNFPQVQTIENQKNVGFARAVNQAYRRARGEFFLILNPDLETLPGSVGKMLVYLRSHPEVGLVLPKLINPDGSLQYSCRTFSSFGTLLLRRPPLGWIFPQPARVRNHLMMDWSHEDTREVDWGLGACMLVRREAIPGPDLLDERFFLYIEDIDLCFSLKKAGWKVVYYPYAVMVHHHLRQSARGLLNRAKWEHLISQLKFYVKHRSLRPKP